MPDKPLPYVWESCLTMGDQWSYKPGDRYKSTHQLIQLLVDIVGKGGNLLLNVGPQPDGELPPEAVRRLEEIGAWMKVNGEAIHGTRPIAPYKEGQTVFTRKGRSVYAIVLLKEEGDSVPATVVLRAIRPAPGSQVQMLGWDCAPGLDRRARRARHGVNPRRAQGGLPPTITVLSSGSRPPERP